MKYLRTYEGWEDYVKESSGLDLNQLKEIIESEFEGEEFQNIDIIQHLNYDFKMYYVNPSGNPIMQTRRWASQNIPYVIPPKDDNKSKSTGIILGKRILNSSVREVDFIKYIYFKLNRDRLKDYGIGYCYYNTPIYGKILFYKIK